MFAVAAAGLLWSVASFFFVWQWEIRQAESNIEQAGATHFLALQTGLDEYLNKLRALRALFASDDDVTRRQFDAFTARLLDQDTAIQNLSWIPVVTRDRRAEFEAQARNDGVADYHIRDVLPDGGMGIAAERSKYLPIFYSTERDGASRIYGIDLLTQRRIRDRLLRAADDADLSTVPDFPLHSRNGTKSGILMSLPVYRLGAPIDTVRERRENLLGFVHGAFVTTDALEHIVTQHTTAAGLDLYVFPAQAGPDDRPLYVHASRLTQAVAPALTMRDTKSTLHAFGALHSGSVQWPIAAVAAAGGPMQPEHDRAWLVLLCNMLVVGFASLYEHKLLKANRRIADLANHDPLTGLANRRAFYANLSRAFETERLGGPGFSVLYLDLDEFKDINDTRGHPAGDKLLREVADRLCKVVGQRDVVARFGGDEFAVLHLGATDDSTAALAERCKRALARPFDLGDSHGRVTASIGIAAMSPDVQNADTLMMRADLALYRAKEDGRNCVRTHTPDLDETVHQRVNLAGELVDAIDNDQLRLWYQPQVELTSGRLVGVEALVRWQHPRLGLLRPAEFIPIAQHAGLIDRLGAWVIEEACRHMRAWSDARIAPDVVAVNVSASQFKSTPELHEALTACLQRHGVEASRMELELTESVLVDLNQHAKEILTRLREAGLRISIDDFGTGYSSLNYLTLFPFSRLKIAQELVLGIDDDARGAAVVRAAVHLAGELGIECIAEGVESAKQLDFLIKAGCSYGQGYYFSRPMSAERMTTLLKQADKKWSPVQRLAMAG